jgi:hypothetical protein
VLVGLVLHATLGWSWADPLAGLVIAAVATKEGRGAWRGEGCCGPIGTGHAHERQDHNCADGCCAPTDQENAHAPSNQPVIQITTGPGHTDR